MSVAFDHDLITDVKTRDKSPQPQFDHDVHPWMALVMAALLLVAVAAFFVYGQVAPGI